MGRQEDCTIIFDEKQVSRLHAELVEDGNSYRIVDHNSTNRTYVNGVQVQSKRLKSGDSIGLSQKISLVFLDEPEEKSHVNNFVDVLWKAFKNSDFLRLKEVTGRMIALDDLESILDLIIREIVSICNADRGFIALLDEEKRIREDQVVQYLMNSSGSEVSEMTFSQSILDEAIRSRDTVCRNFSEMNQDDPTKSALELDLCSVMCSPLAYGDKLIGVIYVDSRELLTEFNEFERFFFGLLSHNASIAIENAILYKEVELNNVSLQEEVEESEIRYKQLVESLPEALLVYSDDKIIMANQAALDLFDSGNEGNLLGCRLSRFFRYDFVEPFEEFCRSGAAEGETFEGKVRTLHENELDVEITIAPVTFKEKDVILLLIRDLTQKRLLEAEILKRQKLESLSVLAGGIVHDFKNILQVIAGNLDMALTRTNGPEMTDWLNSIGIALDKASSLSTQLLTFSKGGTPVLKTYDIQHSLEEFVRFALSGSSTAYVIEAEDNLPFVKMDPSQISHVLQNLLLNADQAMENGGTIRVRAEKTEITHPEKASSLVPGTYVKISVIDEGPGIPDEIINRIFDPYFTTREEGNGLGLSSCYSIIEKHNGKLEVQSVAGEGSTFSFYLPASQATEIEALSPQEKKNIKLRGKILVMDDEAMIRKLLNTMLEKLGCSVTAVANGDEAFSAYKQARENNDPYEAVLLDLTIRGGKGGVETINLLQDYDPDVKAIVASGYCMDPVMANPETYGFVGMIEKPFAVAELSRVLKEVL